MLDMTIWLYKSFMDYLITFSKTMNILVVHHFLIVLFGYDTFFLAIKWVNLKVLHVKAKEIGEIGKGEIWIDKGNMGNTGKGKGNTGKDKV